jgi:hypothetical protein
MDGVWRRMGNSVVGYDSQTTRNTIGRSQWVIRSMCARDIVTAPANELEMYTSPHTANLCRKPDHINADK